jgi:transcriptional regulator with XRE-family HTH domain
MSDQDVDNNVIIGARIREDRKKKRMTLQEVADKTGLSTPYLSQIENGKVNINISNLEVISKALETTMGSYFIDVNNQDLKVVRKKDRKWYALAENAKESLLIKSAGNLEIAVIHIDPGANSGKPDSHPGEEFSYVSRGKVRMVLNDGQIVELEEGDVIYYQSDNLHFWENIGEIKAEVLVVNTPATY